MRDIEVVASIVAGDPEGLAEAYDRYADSLYTYCRSVLREPADAACAVQDTFVIAASRLDGLRDPEKLRPWLYAVARNECLRILRAGKGTSGLDEAPDVSDESADVSADEEHAELRTLFREASEGLGPGEREVVELSLRHKMEAAEIADVLGVPGNHAHSLLSRARGQLEACLGTLLVGRAGRDECKELGKLLGDWDGTLTAALRKRLHRHIEHCPACTRRREFELRPAAFLGLPPLVAIAGELRTLTVPAPVKAKVIALATGTDAAAEAHRAAVLHHAGSFGHNGFPRPVHAGKAAAVHAAGARTGAFIKSPRGRGTAAAVVIAVVAAAAALALTGSSAGQPPLTSAKPGQGNGGSGAGKGGGDNSGHSGNAPTSLPSLNRPTMAAPAVATPAVAEPGSTPRPSSPASAPKSSPVRPAPAKTSSPPSSPAPPSKPTGTITASPNGGLLAILPGGATITLTNSGTTEAYWTMTVSGGSGTVQVTPAKGPLAPGATVQVHVTAPSGLAIGQTLKLAPGGTTWTVALGAL